MEPLNRFPTMMQDYFMRRIRQTEQESEARKFELKSKRDVLAYQAYVRQCIRSIIGPRPRRVPFNVRITGAFEREHYRVENLLFDTRPNFPVTANLYIPKERPLPAPCVLGVCGHTYDGKAAESYQAFCQGLASKGYVVLIIDPIGQGERLQYPDGQGGSRYGGAVGDHIQCANHMTLLGDWFGSWRIWDGIRALDYLLARPEADPQNVGITGNSGGGTMTTWLVAADERFSMAAPGCFVTTWRRNLENELPADSEQNPPRALQYGLDIDDFLLLHAPKPLLLLAQEHDYFDIRGTEQIFARLRHMYRLLGAEENVQLFIGPGEHGFHKELREAMYSFFNKQCGKQKEGSQEPPLEPEEESLLWATPTGRVSDMPADNVPAFTAQKAVALAAKRKPLSGEALRQELARLLGLTAYWRQRQKQTQIDDSLPAYENKPRQKPSRLQPPDYRLLIYSPTDRCYPGAATFYAVETEPGIQALLVCVDKQRWLCRLPAGKEAVLYVPHLSADEDLRQEPLAQQLAQQGRLFAVDVRGRGESRPNSCGGNYLTPYGSDFFYAYFSLMYGENIIGRRVFDVLRILDLLNARGYQRLHLAGRGGGALIALFAGLLHPFVKQLTLKNAPLSYHEMTQDEDYKWPLSAMIWGVLKKLDLPDCYRALGRRLTILEPWNARMEPMPADEARARWEELKLPAACLEI